MVLQPQVPWIGSLVISKGKASNRMTATSSDGTKTIDPSCGAASREGWVGSKLLTLSGSPQACGASARRNYDDLARKGKSAICGES